MLRHPARVVTSSSARPLTRTAVPTDAPSLANRTDPEAVGGSTLTLSRTVWTVRDGEGETATVIVVVLFGATSVVITTSLPSPPRYVMRYTPPFPVDSVEPSGRVAKAPRTASFPSLSTI